MFTWNAQNINPQIVFEILRIFNHDHISQGPMS